MKVKKENVNTRLISELSAGTAFVLDLLLFIKTDCISEDNIVTCVDLESGAINVFEGRIEVTCLPHAVLLPAGEIQ